MARGCGAGVGGRRRAASQLAAGAQEGSSRGGRQPRVPLNILFPVLGCCMSRGHGVFLGRAAALVYVVLECSSNACGFLVMEILYAFPVRCLCYVLFMFFT